MSNIQPNIRHMHKILDDKIYVYATLRLATLDLFYLI